MTKSNHQFGTRAVHAGWNPKDDPIGCVMPPIYLTSTYVQDGPGDPRQGYEYSRTQNPTRFALQDALAELEGGAAGFTFGSGMAAIHTLMLTLKAGDRVVTGMDLYGGSHRLFNKIHKRFGLEFETIDTTDPEALANLPKDTKLLYLETPSNPTLVVTDLEAAAKAAHDIGAKVAVDNTFATPALQQPIRWGADYVVHSTTKYICGHSDIVGGALIAAHQRDVEEISFHQNSAGAVNSPFDAFLTLRGLRTLEVRMERHCSNALQLATWLDQHPAVERVLYPGLPSHAGHATAKKQMSDFGGMFCFVLPGGVPQSKRLVDSCELFVLAESLGGVESLIELPAPMTHASVDPELRKAIGIDDGLVRVSVGIENFEDLRDDLEAALKESLNA